MSNIGIIVDQYEVLVNTTQKINDAVIVLKKQFFLKVDPTKVPKITISKLETDKAKKDLLNFIDYLTELRKDRLDPDYSLIPVKVFGTLKNKIGEISNFDGNLKSIHKRVKAGQVLEKEQFTLLDRIVGLFDKERGNLFKNLRSARE